jgi:hypothetical protein
MKSNQKKQQGRRDAEEHSEHMMMSTVDERMAAMRSARAVHCAGDYLRSIVRDADDGESDEDEPEQAATIACC